MRIDAHISLWQQPPAEAHAHPRFPGEERDFVPAHIEPILARNRFDGAIVFTAGSSAREAETLGAWCAVSPSLLGLSARWPDDASSTAPPPHLKHLRATGTLCGIWSRMGAAKLADAVRFCAANGLAVDIVANGEPFFAESLLPLAGAHPEVPFVLAHAAVPPLAHEALHVWREQMLRLAAHPNVHCKLSALWSSSLEEWNLATLQSLFAFALETFGERRILFGSDWPYCLPAHSWKETLARFTQGLGARTMEFREEVLGNTAARVYRVGSEAG